VPLSRRKPCFETQWDLLRGDADIAVRMVRPTQGGLVARRIGRIDCGLYGHQRYLEARTMPRSLLVSGVEKTWSVRHLKNQPLLKGARSCGGHSLRLLLCTLRTDQVFSTPP
jgi:DNA-binding transcriptional LysR family regulator